MKTVTSFAVLVFAGTFAALLFVEPDNLERVYTNKLQIPLFAGFLTLGSFLLTLKTFVIVKLKESLYDTEFYRERVERQRLLDSKGAISVYGPLNRLATFLIYAVIVALATAAAQLTLGFFPARIPIAVCLSSAATALFLVVCAWWLIKRNLDDCFKMWEQSANSKQPSA